MKKILIFSLLFAGLAACSTTPKAYGPAYGSDFGYQNTKIQHDRFRISYTSRDVNESRDFALLRAAQIADSEGYSHFKIINGGTSEMVRITSIARLVSDLARDAVGAHVQVHILLLAWLILFGL